jgi:hypothetical protein
MAATDTDGDSVAQLAVVVLLLMLSVPTLATAHELAGTPIEYEETATVDYASDYSVAQNATVEGYGEAVTVTVDGQVLNATDDYTWNASSGTLSFVNSSATSSGDDATVQYRAHQRTQETQTAWLIIAPFMGLFGLFSLVSAVRVLWSYSAEVFDA